MSLQYCAYHAGLLTKTKQVLARIMLMVVSKFAYSLQIGLKVCQGRHGLLKCGFAACVPKQCSKLLGIVRTKSRKQN